ncbi:tetratricopeptide repeat protein [Nitratireductor soli]|uniref:tetratricopeptide repeat protein n=1 Tax=Nitratireductor soli TaxID=1670619 RepID=UPI00065E5E4C|nr:tetratricopeptide repeat protein [Nitratireductor soli]
MPVYRAGEQAKRGVLVHAYPSELESWLRAEKGRQATETVDEPQADLADPLPIQPARGRRRLWIAVAASAVVLIVAVGWLAGVLPGTMTRDDGGQVQAAEIPEEARELYLRGTYLWNRRTPEGITGATEALERAIAIHPDYAEAHAGLAMTYNLARQYSGMSGFDAYPLAERHARRAVELDPTLGFAQSVLAFVEFHWLWDVEAGLARFEEALRLDPQSSNTLMWYASALMIAGRPAEALPLISKAQEADPDSSSIFTMKAQALFYNGRVEEAVALLDEVRARDPGHAWANYALYFIKAAQGDFEAYLEHYATLGNMIGVPRYSDAAEAGAAALADGGVEAMAAAMIAVETEYYERGEALAWDIARHHALIGNAEEAIRWLRISLERREERLIGILVDPAFWPIRDKPEFKRLVADIGLPVDT